MNGLLGKKLGMTSLFGNDGSIIPVTLIEAGPCFVTQIKTEDNDGYQAVQLGYLSKKEKNLTKPIKGHLAKSGSSCLRILREFRSSAKISVKPGEQLTVKLFAEGDKVNVSGYSKGRGFAGVMKRYNFSGGQSTHGQSDRARAPGSIGQSSNPSRVFKGMRMCGRMGNKRITEKNLTVVRIDTQKNLLIIKGAVPGPNNGILEIRKAQRK